MASTQGAERGLRRFEGFTDAVFAIALTLLFVEIKPPGSPDGPPAAADAARAVAEQWQDHLALIVSFLGIGIYWLQHHYTGRLYAKSDHVFSLINLGFLFGIMALPYPARLWAFHLGGPGEAEASAILAAGLLLPSLFWLMKWLYASRNRRLIDRRLAPDYVSQMTRRYVVGTAVLALAALIALIAPRLGLALSFAATAYWILPQPSHATDRGKSRAKRREQMIDRALLVRIEGKEGKEDEVESFLRDALAAVREEDKTIDWFAVKFGKRDFAIFDTFPDESGRLAHLVGKVGRALIAKTPTLIEGLPKIEHAEVLASK